ncbi:hypothetical protein PO909_016894 [Leuciscus waleckii]
MQKRLLRKIAGSRPYPDQMVDLRLDTTTTHDVVSRIWAVSSPDGGPAPRHDHIASLKCQQRLCLLDSPL